MTTIQNLESMIDNNIHKSSRNRPMENVIRNKNTKKYVVDEHEFDTMKSACKFSRQQQIDQIGASKIIECEPKQIINLYGQQFLLYEINGKRFFDIWQLINILGIHYRKRKIECYDEYKDEINYVMIKKNKTGGYYLKEFIPEKTATELLMFEPDKPFSKRFIGDVSKILCQYGKNPSNAGKTNIVTIFSNIFAQQ